MTMITTFFNEDFFYFLFDDIINCKDSNTQNSTLTVSNLDSGDVKCYGFECGMASGN